MNTSCQFDSCPERCLSSIVSLFHLKVDRYLLFFFLHCKYRDVKRSYIVEGYNYYYFKMGTVRHLHIYMTVIALYTGCHGFIYHTKLLTLYNDIKLYDRVIVRIYRDVQNPHCPDVRLNKNKA